MRTFTTAQFFQVDQEEWPCLKNERFNLRFADGEAVVTTAQVEVSSKLWYIHEKYPDLPIRVGHHVLPGSLSNNKIQDILSRVVEDTHDIYSKRKGFDREYLWQLVYVTMNRLYNSAIVDYSAYVRSMSSIDFCEVYEHPAVKAIRDKTNPNSEVSLEAGYAKITEVLFTDPTLRKNVIVSDLRAGLVKLEQLLQIIAFRGQNTDIDSYIYPYAITGNYYSGIHDPAEAMMESTLASKSIIFTGQPLEQTEYANRKMQFTSQRVDLLVTGDCGNTNLSSIPLTKTRFRDMDGLYFMDEVTGKLRPLRKWDTDLIGQAVDVRLPFNCLYRATGNVCSTCYGLLANNIPYGANIGHIASVKTQSEISQRVLKIKHSEASTVTEALSIDESERPYIRAGNTANQIKLAPELVKRGVTLLLKATSATGVINASRISVIHPAELKDGQNPAKFSQFKTVTFEVPFENKLPVKYHITVSRGPRTSCLSMEFLRYFLEQSPTVGADGFYRIDLSGWDFSQVVFELPNKHASMKDFASEVEAFIRSTSDDSQRHLGPMRQLRQYSCPVEAILDLHGLIGPKVPVHFTHLAVVMLSLMVGRDTVDDFRLPEAGMPVRFAKYDQIINAGSLGAVFAYQGGRKQLEVMEQYMNTNRGQHLLDPLIYPLDV